MKTRLRLLKKIHSLKSLFISSYTTSDVSHRSLKLVTLLLLTAQNTALVLVTKFSLQKFTPYNVSTVIAFAECVKLVLSSITIVLSEGAVALRQALLDVPKSATRLSAPAVLYFIQNKLLFVGIRLLSPTVYMTCTQSKILTSAFFSVCLLKVRITKRQMISLLVLVLGMILVQSSDTANHSGDHCCFGDVFKGITAVFTASVMSGFAGAYIEKLYKEVPDDGAQRSIWFRNVQLACFSVPISVVAVQSEAVSHNLFVGYNHVVVVIILLQATGGLVVAAVMRYASNVLKCFAVSLSICNCALAATFMHGDGNHSMSAKQLFGIALVISASFAYASK